MEGEIMSLIPSGIFSVYFDACNELLANDFTSSSCTVYYPSIRSTCDNCTTTAFGGITKNVYKNGGNSPFFSGRCPLCGGNGTKEVESTDTLRLRIYWQKKDWIKVGTVGIPDADAMIIGFSSDLPKILRMNEIELISNQNYIKGRYNLSGEPFLHGFGHSRYFVGYLKRV